MLRREAQAADAILARHATTYLMGRAPWVAPPSSRQRAFAAALLDADRDIPEGLVTPDGQPAAKRFGIYRNNVTVSLVNALSEIFPTVQNLVGEDFFRAMARLYVQDNPPASRLLFEYGASFPAFIEQFEPALTCPSCRMLRGWSACGSTASMRPMPRSRRNVLQRVAPEQLAGLTFAAHPATRLFRGDHAAVTIMAATAPASRWTASIRLLRKTG